MGVPTARSDDVEPEQRFSGLRNRFSERMNLLGVAVIARYCPAVGVAGRSGGVLMSL